MPSASHLSDSRTSIHRVCVEQWNATATPYPRADSLAKLVGRWNRETPAACAIVDGERHLSYAELDEQANAVACALFDRGVVAGDRVGVLGNRCMEAIVGILGILKAGAAYVPLDATYPAARLDAMVEDAGIRHVVRLPGGPRQSQRGIQELELAEGRLERRATVGGPVVTGSDLAYVMFTSGTTGRPRAVGVRQRGITRLVVGTDYVEFEPGERVLHASSLSFDGSTLEIWGALLNGGCLVVSDPHVLLSPRDLARVFESEAIASAVITTAAFHQLARREPGMFRSLRNLVVGGEALNLEIARSVLAGGPPERFINGYGPTENTTVTTAYRVNDLPADATRMPIGKPIANTTAYVFRDDGSLAGIGEKGELVTGGDGVAAGYLNDPGLTAERFIQDPFSDDPSARLYRTGDLASWREDGTLDYHGRRDAQFKLHGYRIEPVEIEARLRQHVAIIDAAVLRREAGGGEDSEMVAYIVPADDAQPPSATELRKLLATVLPTFAIPTRFTPVGDLPLSPNGKVDRAALTSPEGVDTQDDGPDRDAILAQVRAIWIEILSDREIDDIAMSATLFDLGGTSFDVPQVHARIEETFDLPELSPLDLFAYPTLEGYCEHLFSLLDGR